MLTRLIGVLAAFALLLGVGPAKAALTVRPTAGVTYTAAANSTRGMSVAEATRAVSGPRATRLIATLGGTWRPDPAESFVTSATFRISENGFSTTDQTTIEVVDLDPLSGGTSSGRDAALVIARHPRTGLAEAWLLVRQAGWAPREFQEFYVHANGDIRETKDRNGDKLLYGSFNVMRAEGQDATQSFLRTQMNLEGAGRDLSAALRVPLDANLAATRGRRDATACATHVIALLANANQRNHNPNAVVDRALDSLRPTDPSFTQRALDLFRRAQQALSSVRSAINAITSIVDFITSIF